MRDPLAPPPAARHPDSVFLLLLCLFSSGSLLLTTERPGRLEHALPPELTTIWAVMLAIGAATVLAGAFHRERATGLLLEFAGRIMLVIGTLLTSGAFIAVAGGFGYEQVLPFLGFALACGWRAWQVYRPIAETVAVLKVMRRARDERDQP